MEEYTTNNVTYREIRKKKQKAKNSYFTNLKLRRFFNIYIYIYEGGKNLNFFEKNQ